MARTVTEIYDGMMLEKQGMSVLSGLQPSISSSQPLLRELKSTSVVGRWRLLFWVVAVLAWNLETLFDLFKVEITAMAAAIPEGTPQWYRKIAMEFQDQDVLVWVDNKFGYATLDYAKRIVHQAAVVDTGYQLEVRVAKLSGSGIVALSELELSRFNSYMQDMKFAGTYVKCVSLMADKVRLSLRVYNSGLLSKATMTSNITVAVTNYLNNIVFNGRLSKTACVNAVLGIAGVNDVYMGGLQVQTALEVSYHDITTDLHDSLSGYYTLDLLTIDYLTA